MIREVLLSAPVAAGAFMALAYGLYCAGGALAARGEELPGKRQPYACGEDLLPPEAQLAYHAFFRLALMFGLLHLATIVISTLPPGGGARPVALLYVFGIVACVLALTGGEDE